MEQPALLECLVEQASDYDGFTFHPATTVTDLRTDESDTVRGVEAHDREADEDVTFEGRCVVGADGRYSTVRASAGIDPGVFDSPIDLVWFKLPGSAVGTETEGQIGRGGILVSFGLGGGDHQIGYLIRDGEWASIREAGFEAFRERVAAVDPEVGAAMATHLDGFGDTTLLDVGPGIADTWTRDGLLLLGDAAHTASPIGAQGNPLAVEDAVVVHDVLVRALGEARQEREQKWSPSENRWVLSGARLSEFESRRRPTVERVVTLQRRAADNFAFWLEYGRYVPPWLVRGSATAFGWATPHSRRIQGLVESFALGDRSVSVARSHFAD